LYNLIPGRPAYGKRDNRYACCWTDYPYYQMYAKDEREYAAGLGQVHYRNYWTYFDLVYYDTDDLVYYKKGNESWGNPLFSSCSAMIPFLSVTPAEITLDFQAGSPGLLSVSTNRGWHISNPANDPWIEFSPSGGNGNGTVNITANAANTVNTVRTAYLLLESPAGNKTIAVRQLPDPSLFMLSAVPDTVVLEAPAASSANLYVTSNNEWTVVNYLPPAWLWYDHFGGTGNGTVNFRSASENSNENPRFATLLLENLVGSHSFTVMQKGRATGISGQTEPKVMVSPNPAGNAAKLTVMGFPVNRSKNLEVFDMTGRTVFSDSFDTDSRLFNRGSLAPGIYLLKICDQRNETMAIQKLVLE
jgi:hypothetical protein